MATKARTGSGQNQEPRASSMSPMWAAALLTLQPSPGLQKGAGWGVDTHMHHTKHGCCRWLLPQGPSFGYVYAASLVRPFGNQWSLSRFPHPVPLSRNDTGPLYLGDHGEFCSGRMPLVHSCPLKHTSTPWDQSLGETNKLEGVGRRGVGRLCSLHACWVSFGTALP